MKGKGFIERPLYKTGPDKYAGKYIHNGGQVVRRFAKVNKKDRRTGQGPRFFRHFEYIEDEPVVAEYVDGPIADNKIVQEVNNYGSERSLQTQEEGEAASAS